MIVTIHLRVIARVCHDFRLSPRWPHAPINRRDSGVTGPCVPEPDQNYNGRRLTPKKGRGQRHQDTRRVFNTLVEGNAPA